MKIGDFTLTRHAIDRALDMGVDGAEIRRCLENPDKIRDSFHHEGQNYSAGRITCGVKGDHVITIVWSTNRGWAKDCLKLPAYAGREYRG